VVGISTEYPEHGWEMWRFGTIPLGFWRDLAQNLLANDPIALTALRHYVDDYIIPLLSQHSEGAGTSVSDGDRYGGEVGDLSSSERRDLWERLFLAHRQNLSYTDLNAIERLGGIKFVLDKLFERSSGGKRTSD